MTVIAPPAPRFPEDWPRFGMGSASLGNIFATYSESDAARTFAAAWDAGVRYFDTAPWYGHGLAEHRLGAALRGWPRDQALISTKVGRVYDPAPRGQDARVQWQGGLNFAVRYDYSAEGFAASLTQSSFRLGQPSVEALIIHDLDRDYHGPAFDGHMSALTGTGLAYLHRLKADGQIAAVGMGMNTLSDFTEIAPWIEVDFFLVAMPYTLADQAALHGPMADCARRGIKVIIGAPFASGLLANPSAPGVMYAYAPASAEMVTKARAIESVCARHGVPLAAAALQFPLLHPAVVSVIPGAVSAAQARQNAENVARPIPPDLWSDLKMQGLIDPGAPTS
ncbi:aldo/keto reductase [Tabrizicola sp.]|uniref:aldo/keto reductase n=1 Tax=Tabrizicola sp. TaxID=2005166 RepID=UPI00262BEFE4|nr:aldo/keto reductase [Tabrizicola sp.]MDM7931690.1 aldo/keto reductase [Tabrizicola sp.]